MDDPKAPVKAFVAAIRGASRTECLLEMDTYIRNLLLKHLGSADIFDLLCELRFELKYETASDLRRLIDPDQIGLLQAEADNLVKSAMKNKAFFVCRVYSHTDKRQLLSIESRKMTDMNSAQSWSEFMDSESNGKHKHFVIYAPSGLT